MYPIVGVPPVCQLLVPVLAFLVRSVSLDQLVGTQIVTINLFLGVFHSVPFLHLSLSQLLEDVLVIHGPRQDLLVVVSDFLFSSLLFVVLVDLSQDVVVVLFPADANLQDDIQNQGQEEAEGQTQRSVVCEVGVDSQ